MRMGVYLACSLKQHFKCQSSVDVSIGEALHSVVILLICTVVIGNTTPMLSRGFSCAT